MIVVLAYYEGDLALATKLSGWIAELGGCENHQALLVQGVVSDDSELRANFEKAFGSVTVITAPKDAENVWPKSANAVFACAARYIEYKIKKPWLFLEPDCVPLKEGWLDTLEAEYLACGKPFMGNRVVVDGVPEHLSGVSLYPGILTDHAGEMLLAEDVAFDVVGAKQMLPKSHFTGLIGHHWDRTMGAKLHDRKVRFEDYQALVREVFVPHPNAVLYHADKSGSAIDLLRKGRGSAAKSTTWDEEEPAHDPAIHNPPKSEKAASQVQKPTEKQPALADLPKGIETIANKYTTEWLILRLAERFTNPLAKGRIIKKLKSYPVIK